LVRTWRSYGGDPLDLLELNRIVLDQQTPEVDPAAGGDNRIEGRVIIHPTAEISSSIILGPTIIGPGARVSNSYIGPYTSIGAGAEIEGAEIERSIISDGARIMHVSGRIEASTVGRRARIFRDFALPRAMRLHVGDGVELALN
jgi:glucose-1-phosphate thymidylyltransferase